MTHLRKCGITPQGCRNTGLSTWLANNGVDANCREIPPRLLRPQG